MATLAATPATSAPRTASAPVSRASHVLTISGVAFVLSSVVAPELLARFYDLVASPGTTTEMNDAARLGAALFGALTFGWGVTLRKLGRGVPVVAAVTSGVVAWFVVDSTASIVLGYAWNALSNVGFAAVILFLLRERRSA